VTGHPPIRERAIHVPEASGSDRHRAATRRRANRVLPAKPQSATSLKRPCKRPVARVPRGVPEPPSTTDTRHEQPRMNLELARPPRPRATHENTLVMRRSTSGSRRIIET
jgi:hypothetical protein